MLDVVRVEHGLVEGAGEDASEGEVGSGVVAVDGGGVEEAAGERVERGEGAGEGFAQVSRGSIEMVVVVRDCLGVGRVIVEVYIGDVGGTEELVDLAIDREECCIAKINGKGQSGIMRVYSVSTIANVQPQSLNPVQTLVLKMKNIKDEENVEMAYGVALPLPSSNGIQH
ncbi:casein kinase I [Striga asiatica]|uniref:Casein kinase I n=1 Tax=Striga asiatica TaxID=4170 RepID=A0A5A7QLV8_STRAF|nr:casein kinase I [Striga asiatica]